MGSTFYGLNIVKSGLFASQKGLETVGHNVANSNTEGYTRQRVSASSLEYAYDAGLFSSTKGQVGAGVEIKSIEQLRDSFLDMQYRRESLSLGEWSVKTEAFQYIGSIFNEPSNAGLNSVLGDLFYSIGELAKQPESKEIRTLVRQDAIKFTETLDHYYNQLIQLQREQDDAIRVNVTEINDYAKQLGDLNEQIFRYEMNGGTANDLRDQRNTILDELSSMINIEYYEGSNGHFRVDINGMALVDHTKVNELDTRLTDNPVDQYQLSEVIWKDSNIVVNAGGGKMKGYMDVRDGMSADNIGIPYFIDKLNNFAKSFVKAFNDVHMEGYTLPYDTNDSKTGVYFFDPIDLGTYPEGINAKNISISQDILDSVFNIAGSGEYVSSTDPSKRGNNENMNKLLELRNDNNIPGIDTSLEGFMKELIAELAVESSHSSNMMGGQVTLTDNLQSQRLSFSGVSIDEEMTLMIQYQHVYSACARMITAMDEALDVLINSTGLVGR